MLGINDKLKDLESKGCSIKTGIVGVGQMGSSMVAHIESLNGMEVTAVANRNVNNAAKILKGIGIETSRMVFLEGANKIQNDNRTLDIIKIGGQDRSIIKQKISKAIDEGKIIVTDDIRELTGIEELDVVVDATGDPEAGAQISFSAISSRKHMVTFNVEADTTIGPLLKKMADNAGIVYTVAAGDEPAATKELYDMADALGLEVIAAGKGKNNPLDKAANPTTLADYAALQAQR